MYYRGVLVCVRCWCGGITRRTDLEEGKERAELAWELVGGAASLLPSSFIIIAIPTLRAEATDEF